MRRRIVFCALASSVSSAVLCLDASAPSWTQWVPIGIVLATLGGGAAVLCNACEVMGRRIARQSAAASRNRNHGFVGDVLLACLLATVIVFGVAPAFIEASMLAVSVNIVDRFDTMLCSSSMRISPPERPLPPTMMMPPETQSSSLSLSLRMIVVPSIRAP